MLPDLGQGLGAALNPSSPIRFHPFLSYSLHNLFSCYASPLHVLSILHVSIATQPPTESKSTEPASE